MAISETLLDVWHNVEDKAWNLADVLEDKGVPIATFCEDKGVSPLLLFGGILVAVIILLAIAGAGGPAGSASLTVYVKDDVGSPIVTMVTIEYIGKEGVQFEDITSMSDGKVRFEKVPYGEAKVSIKHSQGIYKGSKIINIDSEFEELTINAESAKGIIEATVEWDDSAEVTDGTLEIKEFISGTISTTEALDGNSPYTFEVPVGKYLVSVLSKSGNSLKTETVDVREGETNEVDFTLSQDVEESATVFVNVTDENGNVIPGVTVTLQNYKNGNIIGSDTTDSVGQVSFSGLDMQTTVYVTAYKDGDKRYQSLSTYEGKKDYQRTIRNTEETIDVVLALNGRVEVVVRDVDSSLPLSGASVYIAKKDGTSVSPTKKTNDEGRVTFVGFEENIEVYPVVSALGYLDSEQSDNSDTISYLNKNMFYIGLRKDASVQKSEISVNVVDIIYGEAVTGVDALLSDTGGFAIKKVENANNITFQIDSDKRYNVAVHKGGYIRKLLEGLGPGTTEAKLERSNAVNSGEVKVCAFIGGEEGSSPAQATIELLKSTGQLIDSAETKGGSDGDNCVTFDDIPKGWSIYARALSEGHDAVEGDVEIVTALESGITEISLNLNMLLENAPTPGNIRVCVLDTKNNAMAGAEVLLYDSKFDSPSWDGNYRKSTASDGCAIFENIPSVLTNANGVLEPVTVYPIVSAGGYATYNGKEAGNIIAVQPQRTTPINVRLSQGKQVCITTKTGEKLLSGVDVSLCANAPCNQIIETKKTEADGHVSFSTDVDPVTVKVVPSSRYLQDEVLSSFSLSQISQGTCGEIDVAEVQLYASISVEGTTSGYLTLMPMESKDLSFVLMLNGKPFDATVLSSGEQNTLLGVDGTQIDLVLSGDLVGSYLSSIDANKGKYSISITAPVEEGDYKTTLEATIPECESCRGDSRTINIKVDDGDSDNDGVLDEYDECPGTSEGLDVKPNGCEIESVDEVEGEFALDTDHDGVPDEYDAYPNDPSRSEAQTDVNNNGMPDNYETEQGYETSIQVCVVGSSGEPIYGNNIQLYQRGSSSTRSTYSSSGYSQPWVATQSSNNCKVFVGYASTSSLNAASFMSSFYLSVSAGKHYNTYDSSSGNSGSLDIGLSGPGGMFRVTVRLKSKDGSSAGADGTYIDPAREVELSSESWMDGSKSGNTQVIYPVVNDIDRDITLLITYSINGGAIDSLRHTVKYDISGGGCYQILDASTTSLGGKIINFKKGQKTAEDYVTIASKDNCWENNDQSLENDFRFKVTGRLSQLGGKESSVTSFFTPMEIDVKPLVGATRKISSLSDLTELDDKMKLRYGVATLGSLPYCIDSRDNTNSRRLSDRGLDRDEERAAAEHKIVLDFGSDKFPSNLNSLIGTIEKYIKNQLNKSPLACKVYVTVSDDYMGYVKAGDEGQMCNKAKAQEGSKKVEAWEKVFCGAVSGQTEGNIQLDQGYNLRVDSE